MVGFGNMVSIEQRGVEGPPFGNLVQPFQIETLGVRGRMVRLGAELDALLAPHTYPAPVAGLLSETLALAAALASGLKFDGTFILQTRSNGPVGLMVADVTSGGELRGYARFDRPRVEEAAGEAGGPVPRLLGAGHMAFTVDQGPDTERYQGITEIVGAIERRAREGSLSRAERRTVLERVHAFAGHWDEVTDVLAVRRRANALLARHPLRAADAGQLGAALLVQEQLAQPLTFICLDDRLSAAAERESLRVLP